MTAKYPKGSEWRKWDLQVQTRIDANYSCLGSGSLTREQLDKLIAHSGLTEVEITAQEKSISAQKYAKLLVSYLDLFTDLNVIAITDHNSGEELDAILAESNLPTKRIVVLPGVEVSSSHGIHILCIFDPARPWRSTWKESIDHLLTELGITGARFNAQKQPVNVTASSQEVLEAVNAKGGVCIFAHIGTDNGLFVKSNTANGGTAHADIYKHELCQIVQLPQQANVSTGVANIINGLDPHYGKKRVAQIKCSDARKLTEIGSTFAWIKAAPIFEGLKQIVYEPTQRVFVGATSPDAKKPYFTIDKVRFIDNTDNIKFSSEPIEINSNLTAIIGGKSTGKSLLLYYMAKTINGAEVKSRMSAIEQPVSYDFDKIPNFNFEVTWKDGQQTLLRTAEGGEQDDSKQRKILFIPQKYLNSLSEAKIRSREALNDFILNVILQDGTIRDRHEEALRDIRALAKTIPANIAELFEDKEEVKKTEEELKQAGDEKGIEAYIKTLQSQVEEIKAKSGLSDDELKKYEAFDAREKDINTQISNLDEDRKTVSNARADVIGKLTELDSTTNEYESYLNDSEVKSKFKSELEIAKSLEPAVQAAFTKISGVIETKAEKLGGELLAIKRDLGPLLAKVQLQSDLEGKTNAIQEEQQKLNEITIKKNALRTMRAGFKKKAETIIDAYKSIFAKYEALRNEFKAFENKFEDISLAVLIGFHEERFGSGVIREYLNRRDLKKSLPDTDWGDDSSYKYDSTRHVQVIAAIFEGLLSEKIATIKGRAVKDAAEKLLENLFFLDFRILYKNDSLDKMSPGKKGLVLLRLLVSLSNEEWPILLDQPEDDLDNRSVYADLVHFLVAKKNQRQIIIVTHNPNLVVAADAEEIVVANQEGQDVGRENSKYRFEYISGALEDSFELTPEEMPAILNRKGIRQHVCEILEGGKIAFQKREQKYGFPEISGTA